MKSANLHIAATQDVLATPTVLCTHNYGLTNRVNTNYLSAVTLLLLCKQLVGTYKSH